MTTPYGLLSVIVPVLNEERTLQELTDQVLGACENASIDVEIVFVDDGSTDGSWTQIQKLVEMHHGVVRAIRFRRNHGKSQALAAGFRVVRGEYIITIDADLQDDPSEVPALLEKAREGFDLVVGWKQNRKDSRNKVISSRIFNWLANRCSGLDLHDHNCGLKCYHREVLVDLRLYGDMHRMVPSLAASRGFSITEMPVTHHPRKYGESKYGFGRAFRSAFDLATVLFLRRFHDRPVHLIGPIAVGMFGLGVFGSLLGLVRDLTTGQGKVLLIVGPTAILASLVLFCTALLAELLVHEHLTRLWRPPVAETAGLEGGFILGTPAQKNEEDKLDRDSVRQRQEMTVEEA